MAVLSTKDISSRKGNIKSFITSLYFNKNSCKKFENKSYDFPIILFNKEITFNKKNQIDDILNSFLYMTYRTGFINLKVVGCHGYTSDCGWGCTIRCSQMMLSKALIEKKIFDLKQNNINIDNNMMKKIRKEVLSLFNDNYLSIEEVLDHPDYQYFWRLFEEIVKEYPDYNKALSKIIPPYSIHILCKLGNCSGEFTSDMNMIRVITTINSDIFNNIDMINFCVGTIKTKLLFEEFCEQIKGFNRPNNSEIITYNGIDYTLKKGGIIFISFRLGTDALSPNYYQFIPLLFSKFRNNLGIVGGIKRRAYYFIGMQGNNNIIFVDPHITQETKDNSEKYYETYHTNNLYVLDIKEMRCQFSLGIAVFNARQFNQFLEDAKWFNNNYKEVITFDNN